MTFRIRVSMHRDRNVAWKIVNLECQRNRRCSIEYFYAMPMTLASHSARTMVVINTGCRFHKMSNEGEEKKRKKKRMTQFASKTAKLGRQKEVLPNCLQTIPRIRFQNSSCKCLNTLRVKRLLRYVRAAEVSRNIYFQ